MKLLIALFLFFVSVSSNAANISEHKNYWEEWHRLAGDVRACSTNEKVVNFLVQSLENLGNSERTEANADVIEDLVLRIPRCFCAAYQDLSKMQKQTLATYFIRAPLYHKPSDMKEALNSATEYEECTAF